MLDRSSQLHLLEVQNLRIELTKTDGAIPVVDGVSFQLLRGETLAIVGESGCGKSVTALAIGRLLPPWVFKISAEKITVAGKNILSLPEREMCAIRGRQITYIFQHVGAVLNPVMTVRAQIMEMLRLHRPGHANEEEVERLLETVGFDAPERIAKAYPFMLSGGMQQRVAIAIAMASHPQVIIADEPTSALDVTTQAKILELFAFIKRSYGVSFIFITHNLRLVPRIADTVAVMYAGQIIEYGPVKAVLEHPSHPYTQALIECIPDLNSMEKPLCALPGTVPVPGSWPKGCRFQPRCKRAISICDREQPPLQEISAGKYCRCFIANKTAYTTESIEIRRSAVD